MSTASTRSRSRQRPSVSKSNKTRRVSQNLEKLLIITAISQTNLGRQDLRRKNDEAGRVRVTMKKQRNEEGSSKKRSRI